MKSEKPPFERMEGSSDSQKPQYDQKLLETRNKCLPLLERLVVKFSEYKKICTALKEKRPPLEWLNKLEATCEKIEKKMTAQFFEKLDEAEREQQNNTSTIPEERNTKKLIDKSEKGIRMRTEKLSRWDIKPELNSSIKSESPIIEKDMAKDFKITIPKTKPAYENRCTMRRGLSVIDLTKNEDIEEPYYGCKTRRSKSKDREEQDLDVEIIASTAGFNPLRRAKSQTQFATLEEVNKSPFYKKFTSDNMTLGSRAANLKYGTVFDLVQSKEQPSNLRHRKYLPRRYESLSKRPTGGEEHWSNRRDYDYKKYLMEPFDKKAPPRNKSHISNSATDKSYEHLKINVKFFDRNTESNNDPNNPRHSDENSKNKYGKSDHEFQGKIPFYKQNIDGNSRISYPEKSFSAQPSKDPVSLSSPDLYPPSDKSFPSSQSVANSQFNSIVYPQQACSFHCNCCKSTPYFSGMGASYQPTLPCAVGNSNYPFFSGQYFPSQPVISPLNKNLPTPFPTYGVPPLPSSTLAAPTPYQNANKPGYSVPVFCNDGSTRVNKTPPTLLSWNTNNQPDMSCRNVMDNTIRPKDPRTDTKDRFPQSPSNVARRFSTVDSSLAQVPCFSGISEERFSQSCTFLRPDNLYKDFKCHSDDRKKSSFESLKSFGLANNVAAENLSDQIELPTRPITSKGILNNGTNCKINNSEINNLNENSNTQLSINHSGKQEIQIPLDRKCQQVKDNYISPLSNLYSDSPTHFEGYNNITNKQLDNRKRKYDEGLGRSFSCNDYKRKKIGKVEPMSKFCQIGNKEYPIKRNPNSKNSSDLKLFEISDYTALDHSPRSDDTVLPSEQWEQIKSPTEWTEKDCQVQYSQKGTREPKTNINDSIPKEELHSEITPIPQKKEYSLSKGISFSKEKLTDKGESPKKVKEQKTKPKDTTTISKPSKNFNDFEKQIPAEKDNPPVIQKCIPSKNTDIKKEAKVAIAQKEKIDGKLKVSEKIITTSNSEQNVNSSIQSLLSENSPIRQKSKLVVRAKSCEKNILPNQSVNDKKKCKSTQSHRKDKSTVKETCLEANNSSSTKSLSSKTKEDSKMSTPLKEKKPKDKDSEKNTLEVKNKHNHMSIAKRKLFIDIENSNSSETSLSSQKTDNCKTLKSQKCKHSSDNDKQSATHKSKNLSKIDNENSHNKEKTKNENSEIFIKDNTPSQISDSKVNSQSKLPKLPQSTSSSNPNDKLRSGRKSSKKQITDKVKECNVVLKKGKRVITDKCNDGSDELLTNTLTSPNVITHTRNKTDSQMSTDSLNHGSKYIENPAVYQNDKPLVKEKSVSDEMTNCDNDKVKDLVLRMKSLSQSEALKVITEFASTLAVNDSIEKKKVSKDQRVPSKGEEMEQTINHIKIKDEIIDDYSEQSKTENRQLNKSEKAKVCNFTRDSCSSPQSEKSQAMKTNEIKESKRKLKPSDTNIHMPNPVTEIKNFDSPAEKQQQKLSAADTDDKDLTEKCKYHKKKKLSELEKIHADLEKCHALDDIMKCSRLRTCRLKNESSGPLLGIYTDENQPKKRRVAVSPEESFFIEDEITIKMEPIPELPFDSIKQEPDYF